MYIHIDLPELSLLHALTKFFIKHFCTSNLQGQQPTPKMMLLRLDFETFYDHSDRKIQGINALDRLVMNSSEAQVD